MSEERERRHEEENDQKWGKSTDESRTTEAGERSTDKEEDHRRLTRMGGVMGRAFLTLC